MEALDKIFWEYGTHNVFDQPGRFYPILLQAAQEKCRTYFDRVEQQAAQFAEKKGLNASIQSQQLVKKLAQSLRGLVDRRLKAKLAIKERDFVDPCISDAHSVWYATPEPLLLLKANLPEPHKLLALGHEIGYHVLKLAREETHASPPLKPLPEETRSFPLLTPARSFVDRWDDFAAARFARALLMPREGMQDAMRAFFRSPTFDRNVLLEMARSFRVTPGLLLSRFADLLPQCFPTQQLFYLRCRRYGMYCRRGAETRVTFYLNESSWRVIDDASALSADACRRWLAMRAGGEKSSIQAGRFRCHDSRPRPMPPAVALFLHYVPRVARAGYLVAGDSQFCHR